MSWLGLKLSNIAKLGMNYWPVGCFFLIQLSKLTNLEDLPNVA